MMTNELIKVMLYVSYLYDLSLQVEMLMVVSTWMSQLGVFPAHLLTAS